MTRRVKWLETRDTIYVNGHLTPYVALNLGLDIINGMEALSFVYLYMIMNNIHINKIMYIYHSMAH